MGGSWSMLRQMPAEDCKLPLSFIGPAAQADPYLLFTVLETVVHSFPGWDLHPLERAAFSRRTPKADLRW